MATCSTKKCGANKTAARGNPFDSSTQLNSHTWFGHIWVCLFFGAQNKNGRCFPFWCLLPFETIKKGGGPVKQRHTPWFVSWHGLPNPWNPGVRSHHRTATPPSPGESNVLRALCFNIFEPGLRFFEYTQDRINLNRITHKWLISPKGKIIGFKSILGSQKVEPGFEPSRKPPLFRLPFRLASMT